MWNEKRKEANLSSFAGARRTQQNWIDACLFAHFFSLIFFYFRIFLNLNKKFAYFFILKKKKELL